MLGLLIAAAVATTVLRWWLLGSARIGDFAPAVAFDVIMLGGVWAACEAVARWLGPKLSLAAFVPVVVALTGLIFAHTWFFHVAIERKLTVLDMTPGGIRYFFEVALPPTGRWAMLLMYGGMTALALLLRGRLRLGTRGKAMVAATLVLALPWVLQARVLSPLFDSSFELWQVATLPGATPAPAQPIDKWLSTLDKSQGSPGVLPTRYKKVIVLVMETMTAESFAQESEALPAQTFVHAQAHTTQRFERYFPNNQDSRTGMLDMLFSRLIPYDAYLDAAYERYRPLVHVPSLVDRMRAHGYATAFAVSQTTLEAVVGELPWSATLHLSDSDVEHARAAQQLCFVPDEYETSCEDLSLLPKVLDFVAQNERAFVYQEFIWGHAAVYNQASGKSNAAYYSAYVDALREGLKERGMLDDTLLVLTSDHGFRDRARQDQLGAYRLPLLFQASDLTAHVDKRLLSHADLSALLFERLAPGAPKAPDNELVMIVGPTGQGNLFVVGRGGGHVLLRHKAGRDMVVAQRGAVPLTPGALLTLFRTFRAQFDRALAREEH